MSQYVEVGGETVEFPDNMTDEQIADVISSSQKANQQVAEQTEQNRQAHTRLNPVVQHGEAPAPMKYQPYTPAPTGKPMGVDALRTGAPMIATLITRNPASLALITGLSELTARELEERYEDPEYRGTMDFLRRKAENVAAAGTSAGLSYVGDRFFAPWLTRQVEKVKNFSVRPFASKTAGRILLPGETPPQAATAQQFLGKLYPEPRRGPFSLTLDQMHSGQKTLMENLGSFARSSYGGGGRMRKMDLRNEKAVTAFVNNFLKASDKTTPRQFGNMLASLLNKDQAYIMNQTNALFDAFRETIKDKGLQVDLSDAFGFLEGNMDNRFVRNILSKVMRSDPKIMNAMRGAEELRKLSVEELENYFDTMLPSEARKLLDEISYTLPAETAVDMYHNMNRMFRRSPEKGIKKYSKEFKKRVEASIRDVTEPVKAEEGEFAGKNAYTLFREANDFAAKHGERIEQKVIQELIKKVGDEKPAAMLAMLSGAQAGDRLAVLKRFFSTSDVLGPADFERTVKSPLRHWMLSLAADKETGVVSGAKLARILDTAEKNNGPEFLREVFGPHAPRALREAATTLNLLQSTKESNIVIKIMQATAISGVVGVGLYGGQPIERVAAGAFAVVLAPLALARILSNPTMVRTLTDGFAKGVGSTNFQRALTVAIVQNRQALKDMATMSPNAQEFYSNIASDEEVEVEAEPPLTFGEMGGTMGIYFPDERVR